MHELAKSRRARGWTRRGVLKAGLAALPAGAALTLVVHPAEATPEAMRDAIRRVTGDAAVKRGRVKLDIPPLSENGNSVSCAVTVESPMTAADHVKAIHVFNEKNPQTNVIIVRISITSPRLAFFGRWISAWVVIAIPPRRRPSSRSR